MTRQEPLVSVIVPVYGTERFLERCVESVAGQSHSNLEILLVDDGSTDRCPEMCDAFADSDPRVTVIHKANGGQGTARNAALDVCTGEYIMFVDSDDSIRPEMIRNLLDAALENDCDLVLCGYRTVSRFQTIDHRYYDAPVSFDNQSLMREYLLSSSITRGPVAKLYERHLFDAIRFPAIRAREDAYIMHELLGEARKAVFVPEPYYIHRLRSGSTEGSGFDPAHLVSIEIGDRLVDYVSQRYPTMAPYARYRRAQEFASLMTEIRSSFCYRRNRRLYRDLQAGLSAELPSLVDLIPECNVAAIVKTADSGLLFRCSCLLAGAKRALSSRIEAALAALSRMRMNAEA